MNKLILPLILIALGITSRLFPHPANVAPIAAIALFGGLYLPKRMAYLVPMIAMLIGDAIIGFYDIRMMIPVYASFLVTIYFGLRVRENKTFVNIAGATLIGSIIFFLTTNAAVWGFGTMYPYTLNGLGQSYLMALPFFRNSLLGDFFFVTILVGSYEWVQRYGLTTFLQKAPSRTE